MDLSIIIPIYNTNIDTLKECIKSIIQIKSINYEVILIDDGSEKKHSIEYRKLSGENIKYFKQENQGVSSARNYGLTKANGKYIMFVDSDDFIYANNLNKLIFKKKYDMILYNCNYIRPNNKIVIMKGANSKPGILEHNVIIQNFIENCGLHFPSFKLYSREFIINNNITFDKNMMQGEDAIFNLDIIEKRPSIYYIDKSIYGYNFDYSTSSSRWDKNPQKMFDNLEYLYDRKEELVKQYDLNLKYLKMLNNMYINNLFSLCIDKSKNQKIHSTAKLLIQKRISLNNISIKSKIKYCLIIIHNRYVFGIISQIRNFYLKHLKKNY